MYALEKISTGTTREAGHQPDGTEYPAWSGQDGKNYGSERGCNSFLNVSFVPIAPQSVTREDHDGISHNLITQENYEFLRDSYFRYAGLLNVDAPHDRGKSIGEGIANLYNEFAALLDETVHVNYEERNGRLYFNLWQAHTWGKYTLYYFPVKFVEALNPKLRRIALSFVSISAEPSYQWSLDGQPIEGANSLVYGFKPAKTGEHTLTFTVKYDNQRTKAALTRNIAVSGVDEVSVNIPVKCCEATGKRPFAAGNSIYSNKVYEFVPAPGQFVNETNTAGFNGESTHEAACAYAQKRLDNEQYVSLGGWGGYIVVGFDHSIENKGGYDFSIKGNAFDSSNEPGIVWVMQDVNGDGLPNDEWYELKGSEYGKPETIQDYAVTYFRPGPNMDTQWQDNKGNKGAIDRLGNYHPQEFYYPLWIEEDSYTLYGTCLKARTEQSPSTGMWSNNPFGWGYADNIGDDMPNKDNPNAGALGNYFKISDAVNIDGTSANLSHIDFIKVQTGVNVKAGWLGENSTEVFKFCDENNNNDK